MDEIKYLKDIGINISISERQENQNKTVIVGMSGGVDSSVAALVLKMMGYKVIGLFMRNWDEVDEDGHCSAEADFSDVVKVCEKIDIPYYSIDFVQEYRENVFNLFLEDYKNGHTPNPDILCNKEIKFKVFYDKAMELGADFLATGHYCQVDNDKMELIKGVDQGKDQTYFLYAINKDVLKNVLFPIGHLEKKYVRQVAKDFDLATKAKKDSTGICFIGERNFKNFLGNYIKNQKGNFVRLDDNKVLSEHDGQCFYTIGQRKGLGLGGPGGPWFVAKKEVESNTVFVVEGENHPALYSETLVTEAPNWLSEKISFPLKCKAKVRYRQPDQECEVTLLDGNGLQVTFKEPQRAVAVRQSIVFYQDDLCLGGAVIKSVGESLYESSKPSTFESP